MTKLSVSYSRSLFTLFDVLANVGGLYGTIEYIGAIFVSIFGANTISTKIINIFINNRSKYESNEDNKRIS